MVMYDKFGKETERDIEAFAKKQNKFYIKLLHGRVFNPHTVFRIRDAKWTKVSEEVYNIYIKFLDTRKSVYLTQAQRNMR